jgi:hypothetical protein
MTFSERQSPQQSPSRPVFDFGQFLTIADRIAVDFFERTRAMTELSHSSILFSDGLCVCALCEMYEINCLVEAGTGCGGSTEMFARYFADGSTVKRIWSVDLAVNPVWAWALHWSGIKARDPFVFSSRWAQRVARTRLSPFENVELVYGDALVELPAIVRELTQQNARVGVLIDGPKGASQLRLAHELLAHSPSVCFAALDDIGPMYDAHGRYAHFRSSPYAAFATSDHAFFNRYAWVNAGRLPARMIGRPDHTGYGVGVLVNGASTV